MTTELEGGDRQRAMKRLRVPPLGAAQVRRAADYNGNQSVMGVKDAGISSWFSGIYASRENLCIYLTVIVCFSER